MQLRARAILVALAAAAVSAVAAGPAIATGGPASQAGKGKTPKVKVRDDFFAPTKVKVKRGQKVKWAWGNTNFNPHDVTLKKGPKGVKKKKFRSRTASIGYSWSKKFKVKGVYDFFCTIHPITMNMTVKVR